ncbi:MAG: DUF1127 domain-containing protein [Sulfitobacter sp.]
MTHTSTISNDALSILSEPGTPIVAVMAVKFAVLVTTWATRRRTRIALAKLDPWLLHDVGLTPTEAHYESCRVFWRV